MIWKATEVHTHTIHSDGSFTVKTLMERAAKNGLEIIALTDHNTDSATYEAAELAKQITKPEVIAGIEWTSFFGHVIVLAPDRFVEFRDITPDTIDLFADKAHQAGATVGVAHPFAPGEPFCCGCHWDFTVKDWSKMDTIEVWHEALPQFQPENVAAYRLWKKKLDAGYRLTGVSARDWHGGEDDAIPYAVTYLGLDAALPTAEAVKKALRNGNAYMTMGPTISFILENETGRATMGDDFYRGSCLLRVSVGMSERSYAWDAFGIRPEKIRLIENNMDVAKEIPFLRYDEEQIVLLHLKPGTFRIELCGTMQDQPCTLAITNAVYVR